MSLAPTIFQRKGNWRAIHGISVDQMSYRIYGAPVLEMALALSKGTIYLLTARKKYDHGHYITA